MSQHRPRRYRLVVTIVLLVALIGVLAIVMDWREMWRVLARANWRLLPVSFLFGLASYGFLGYVFVIVYQVFGVAMSRRQLFLVGLVSAVLNNVLSTGGVAGYSVRVMVMRQHGASLSTIIAASVFHLYLNTLAALALLPIGLLYLLLAHPLARNVAFGLVATLVLLTIVFLLATALMLAGRLRALVLRRVSLAARQVAGRDIDEALGRFDAAVNRGVAQLRASPALIAALFVSIVCDWGSSIICLAFCFAALGHALKPVVLITGYAVGIAAGAVAITPGGLGLQEGSMAGVYSLLGVPLGEAVLAAILFRLTYYFLPFLLSLVFYRRMLRTP